MRKNIDLDDETRKALAKMAIDANTNLKNFIEAELKKIAAKAKKRP